jgi:WD40 repeat protein
MHHLATAADDWDTLGRPTSELYRGGRLESALEWRDGARPDLTAVETDFLDASAEVAESERRRLAAEALRQARQNRHLRWALAGAAALLVAAVAGGLVAVRQRREAQEQRRDAAISALVGDANALRSNRRDLAALLAVEAYRLRPDAESESALFGTFTAAPGAEQVVRTGVSLDNRVRNADAVFLPDNNAVVFGDAYAGVHLVDLGTGEAATLPTLSDRPSHSLLAVSSDGHYLATAWRQPLPEPELSILTVWDLETETRRFSPVEIPVRAGDLAISDDGSMVAVGGGIEMRALTFDGATGAALAEAERLVRPEDAGNQIVTAAVRFLPDGRLLVGSQAPVLRIIDPRSGEQLERFDVPQESTHAFLGLAEDGQSIVGTGVRRSLGGGDIEWDGTSGDQCNSFVLAESIGELLCGEWSGRVIAFDLQTGAEIGARFDSQQGDVCSLAVSPDGRRLVELAACSGDDLMLVEWRLDGGGPVSKRLVATTGERSVAQFGFGETDALVAEYAPEDGAPLRTYVLDTASGEELATFDDLWGFVPTEDPRLAAVIYDDGENPPTFGLYDTALGAPAGPVIDPAMRIDGLWSDGRIVVVGEEADPPGVEEVRVFDLATGRDRQLELAGEGWRVLQDVVFGDDELYLQVYTERDGRQYNLIQRVDRASLQRLAEAPVGDYRKIATNGTVLTAATVDGHVVELDPVSLDVIGAPFPGTNGQVGSMAIDASGRRLMVRADDDSLRFYDVPTRTQLGDPIDTDATFANAVLRGDGMMAAAVTGDGIVVWDLDPAHWVDAACRLAGRNMTPQEWDRYLGDLAGYRETCPQ